MKVPNPLDLTHAELAAIVARVQSTLWEGYDGFDPDKEWDSDTLELVGHAMERLRPHPAPTFIVIETIAYEVEADNAEDALEHVIADSDRNNHCLKSIDNRFAYDKDPG
jgi:uncharacterized radical SAM superfamily Fe-S cluster-containing enzyme